MFILQQNLENLDIVRNNLRNQQITHATPKPSTHDADQQRAGKRRRNGQATQDTPDIVTSCNQTPERRIVMPHMTSNTSYTRYCHRTPPTAKIRTVTPRNNHCPTAILAGSNGRLQDLRRTDVPKNKESQRSHGEIHHPHAIGHGRRKADRTH